MIDPKTVAVFTSLLVGATFLSYKSLDFSGKATYASEGWTEDNENENSIQFSPSLAAESKVDIDEFLIGVIENFKEDMVTGIKELKVPILDPFVSQKPIKINVEDSKATVHGNFTDLKVVGMSGFVLEQLHADLQNLSLSFELRIPRIRAVGNYSLEGKIIKIIPLRGNGEFWVESHNLSVAAKASMHSTQEDDHLQLSKDFDVEMDFEKVELYLENFLGGGRWTEILLKIVNDISKDLFRMSLPLLKEELNKSLLKVINKHLMKLPITSIIPGSSANEYVDQILSNVQKYVRDNSLDPMQLPDYATNFSKEVAYITFNGEAKLYDGWLAGISTLHRTDECQLKTNRTTITVSAHLGLLDLRLAYKGR
ncbi:hypothetical protein JTE90_000785 [Oedothorax gibbosus]|uniref:Uncharacterized protein n=1 Tax=Oedothorax gibbosus TaxID=931172 RepID=A0AAV6UBA2_9ARAC|nr:hypothetical protein JTE90_000785 [Oedothorax gibbosus]